MNKDVLVTGGLGFIGAAFITHLTSTGASVVNVDAGTYAADKERLGNLTTETHLVDVRDPALAELVATKRPNAIVHFAAETHVTRSETDAEGFFSTNVDGTRAVLDAARDAGVETVLHVSTDEVYGPALDEPFRETDKGPGEGKATSAYARSKAVADDLALTYANDLRVIVVRPTNCFGPWQHPEKAIARWTARALADERLPVWGDGEQIRDWMYVDDACSAIALVMDKADRSDVFNIGPGRDTRTNRSIAEAVAQAAARGPDAVYLTAYDRPDHDRRYSVDATKLRNLGWSPEVGVEEGIRRTVAWFADNRSWWVDKVGSAEALYDDVEERR
ncbi:MAG: dTDP-glucose 4,6-dehydratase [Actinomycetota bacterium]|jgi:dTDP-glucose 4,6-dehydratase|nr:dTDP-glucose 4,6-dehydratase [Actinomycetota bacterium]